MTTDRSHDRAASLLNRRAALASGAALLTAGGSLVLVGEPVSAAVDVDQLTVSDASFTAEEVSPVLDVEAGYEYDAGNSAVSALRFELAVDGTLIASDELVTDRTTLEGTTTLSGPITDSDAWAAADFSPAVANRVTREITVELSFGVLGSDDTELVSDSATDTAVIEVAHPQESKYVASVGGVGTIRTAADE